VQKTYRIPLVVEDCPGDRVLGPPQAKLFDMRQNTPR
jgi:hypothetical protein